MCWEKVCVAKEGLCPDSASYWKGLGCCLQNAEGQGVEVG